MHMCNRVESIVSWAGCITALIRTALIRTAPMPTPKLPFGGFSITLPTATGLVSDEPHCQRQAGNF